MSDCLVGRLVHEGRDHETHCLRQDDPPHGLSLAHSNRFGGVGLTAINRKNARSYDLAIICRGMQAEPEPNRCCQFDQQTAWALIFVFFRIGDMGSNPDFLMMREWFGFETPGVDAMKKDFRDFLNALDQAGELHTLQKPVDVRDVSGLLTAEDVRVLSGQTEGIIAKDQTYLTELAAAVRGRLARQPAREAEPVAN